MAAIQTIGLTKRYGESVLAVDDLALTVEEGEVFGFLGPNGAGKSTTINMILDFVRPTDGTATVLGLDAQADTDEIRHRIGVLPEGVSVYDRLTAREHLQWVIDTKGTGDDPDAILERVGLAGDDADRPAGDYSKGMAQRLGFGMALVGDPDLLILDEPSSGLDPAGMQEMRDIIAEEADRGTTVFFSSHILGEVEAVCDRIGIMNEGHLAATGTLGELQDELDLGVPITLKVDAVPESLELEHIEGVRSVQVDGTTITATCAEPAVKADVVRRVLSATEIRDIISEDVSVEQLFHTYTNGESADDAALAPEVTA
ncbi:ABC transporter ATP-binding protein [Natrinema caseinilyticum]|uniref:ABC transporter ATP-binding protein n=1 Tax=Natrinema caseinilyticum TaxID=2961570 RepID=UPI0020C4C130|nr:ABC transporter ATP-binding protein [Natrinema caseinilyticum]